MVSTKKTDDDNDADVGFPGKPSGHDYIVVQERGSTIDGSISIL